MGEWDIPRNPSGLVTVSMPTLVLRPDAALTHEEIFEIVSLLNYVWPKGDATVLELVKAFPDAQRYRRVSVPGSGQPAIRHLIRDREELIAHALSFERTVISENGQLPVMALSGVCITPSRRGQGLGREVARSAFTRVDEGEFPVALFQTGVPAFYRDLGAEVISTRFFDTRNRIAPHASPWNDEWIMIYPGGHDWPQGAVDLNGPGY